MIRHARLERIAGREMHGAADRRNAAGHRRRIVQLACDIHPQRGRLLVGGKVFERSQFIGTESQDVKAVRLARGVQFDPR